jgi:diguanylate cyclase (GGDEF)-like protein/putative nucleotidyltransferase with HDIG domain
VYGADRPAKELTDMSFSSPSLDIPVAHSRAPHPMDSSRLLLALTSLVREGVAELGAGPQEGVPIGVLRRLLAALHYRDPQTLHHSRRVALITVGIAERLGWDENELYSLEAAALLHDIGKVGVPDHVLYKPAKLSPDEADLIGIHHFTGVGLLQACRMDKTVIQIVSDSYAAGTGEHSELHQGARILTVADAFDSMSRDQVYRKRMSQEHIFRELMGQAGKRFDRNVVSALQRWVDEDGLNILKEEEAEVSMDSAVPVDDETIAEAHTLCHVFSYLYLLETLYDGFYILNSDLKYIVWSRGAESLFQRSGRETLGDTWTRRGLKWANAEAKPFLDETCPMQKLLDSPRPACANLLLPDEAGKLHNYELLLVPILDEQHKLQGIAHCYRALDESRRRKGEFRELKLAATRDALTSLPNRKELENFLTKLYGQHAKGEDRPPFSVIFADIDRFKAVNDKYSHVVGDQVLVDFARILQDEVYSGELVARYGGEEFVIVCPETTLDDAERRAERLRRTIAASLVGGDQQLKVTASFGVAQIEPGDSIEDVIRRADEALYIAKKGGRNRTAVKSNGIVYEKPRTTAEPEPEFSCKPTGQNEVTMTMRTAVASDILVYKLSGFVDETKAKLGKVSKEEVEIVVGKPTMFGGWGADPDRQPIQICVHFLGEDNSRGAAIRQDMKVVLTAVGRPKSPEQFQIRVAQVLDLFRGYCVAD